MRLAIKQLILTVTALLLFVGAASAETITVPSGGNLQAAINTAQPGDVIIVEAGATFRGPFELVAKSGDAEIVIQSSKISEIPQGRVSPALSPLMPKIVAPSFEQAIRTKPGAHHYRLEGIEVSLESATGTVYDLVRLGDSRQSQQTLASVPHHIKLDRLFVHGFTTSSAQRGISLNSSDSELTRSYISDIHWSGTDSQAVCWWNTPGRNRVVDNFLDSASENILIGGSDPFSADFIPTGDQILRNYVFKPLTYKGKGWAVKNLLELKNARQTLIEGNVFENCWTDGQQGIAILFTARNQEGSAPYSVVENVTFTNNTIKNAEGGVHFLRTDAESKGAITSNVTIANNVFEQITGSFLTLVNNPNNITVVHNTVFKSRNTANIDARAEDPKGAGLILKDNLLSEGDYGVHGSGVGEGGIALTTFFQDAVFVGNNMAGRAASIYPSGNTFLITASVGFINVAGGDYRLSTLSPLKGKATDGKDAGADIDQLLAAQSGTVTGPVPNPPPSPTPTPTPTATPTPVPSPTPLPSPSPSPTPLPSPCAMTVSGPLSLPSWGMGTASVTLQNMTGAVEVKATTSSGQVTVNPWWPIQVSGRSAVIQFQVGVKKKGGTITFSSLCGSKSLVVNVKG